jgi:hypothetical protein
MIEYIDIPDRLNFSLDNVNSVKQVHQLETEIFSRLELTDKKTIRFKDKLLNNRLGYVIINEIDGLTEFMKSSGFLDIDYKKLLALDPDQKEAIKPFINHAYFQIN